MLRYHAVIVILLMSVAGTTPMGYCSSSKQEDKILIQCQDMNSFSEVIDLLKNDASPKNPITLEIDNSNLDDLPDRRFKELNMTIGNLKLNNSGLRKVNPRTFTGLTAVQLFSLADNPIPNVPTDVIREMPNIATLDLGRMHIRYIREESFHGLGKLQSLILPSNYIEEIDTNSIPINVQRLHLGHNRLRHLNGTLRHLNELIWLFVNDNQLISLDDELPTNGSKLGLLHAANNKLEKVPREICQLSAMHSLFICYNKITSLDGNLAKCRALVRVQLDHNHLKVLHKYDFAEATNIKFLFLGHNRLTTLNNSMHPLINLTTLNVSHNRLEKFFFEEIKGLDGLETLDLSNNHIRELIGFTMNSLEWGSNLSELFLEHNDIHQLNGSVSGFRKLIRLNVSFNKITRISSDDFIGLEKMEMLDISHNHLTTLEETSKTYLPQLQELLVSHNYLKVLDKDFHGLPVLCWADLSYNEIISIGNNLVSKTHCKFNDNLHSAVFRNLMIDLKGNPIVCDASYPALMIAMENNHTNLSGNGTDCASFIDLSITQHNNFVGYNDPVSTPPSVVRHHHNEPHYLNPVFSVPYNPIVEPISNQVKKSIQEAVNEDLINHQNQIQPTQIIRNEETTNIRIPEQVFVPLSNQYQPSKVEPELPKPMEPLPYQHQLYLNAQDDIMGTKTTIDMGNKPLTGQHVYAHIDPVLQEQQLSQLATEIEQLKAKVEELSSENQRLAQNLNHQNLEVTDNKFFEDTRPILPLSQIPVLSTIKPPNEDYERTP